MKKRNSGATDPFDYLYHELWVNIFMILNVADRASVSMVCKYFNKACRDPSLWHKLDLSKLSNYRFNVPQKEGSWEDEHSSIKMTLLLKSVLNLSMGNTTCLIFNDYVHLSDVQLISTAERTPNLKRLVLPSSGTLTESGIKTAMKLWGGLESITLTSMVNLPHIFSAINNYCKNITQLKLTCNFLEYHADSLVKYTPNLTTLSIRSVIVCLKALCHVLKSMQHLKVVNISHSIIVDIDEDEPIPSWIMGFYDLKGHLDDACLEKLIVCEGNWCQRCKRDTNPWREDEITSLTH